MSQGSERGGDAGLDLACAKKEQQNEKKGQKALHGLTIIHLLKNSVRHRWGDKIDGTKGVIMSDVIERFLRYIKYETTSDLESSSYPSTASQLELLKVLAEELKSIGLEEVKM